MFESIQIGNFKAFGKSQNVKLKPITLIFGPNSSGKSSIIHSLAFMHHAITTSDFDIHHTIKGGNSIDLGGIKQALYKNDFTRRVEWGVEISNEYLNDADLSPDDEVQPNLWSKTNNFFDNETKLNVKIAIGIELDDLDQPVKGSKPKVYSYDIESGSKKFLGISQRPDGSYNIDYLNKKSVLTERIVSFLRETTKSESINYDLDINSIIHKIKLKNSVFPSSIHITSKKLSGLNTEQKRFVKLISKLIESIFDFIKLELDSFEYLGPLRSYPPRNIEIAEDNDPNFKAGGGFAWKMVLENSEVRKKINRWLSSEKNLQTTYELDVKYLHTIDKLDKYYQENIHKVIDENIVEGDSRDTDIWSYAELALSEIKSFEGEIAERKEIVLKDKNANTEVSHRDIGIGISQVLPVLACSLGYVDKTVAIEQPEIHLHPTLQSNIARIFVEAKKENDNNFIIETHSEHLVKSLQVEVAKWSNTSGNSGISPEEVSILYVTKNHEKHDGALVKEMKLDENGSFIEPWPDDFFEQSNQLTIERLKQLKR